MASHCSLVSLFPLSPTTNRMIAPIIKTFWMASVKELFCWPAPRHWTRQCYHGETNPSQVFFLLPLSCRSGYCTSLTLFSSSSDAYDVFRRPETTFIDYYIPAHSPVRPHVSYYIHLAYRSVEHLFTIKRHCLSVLFLPRCRRRHSICRAGKKVKTSFEWKVCYVCVTDMKQELECKGKGR